MGVTELFLIAAGLSMDAFAVSVCKGLAMKQCTFQKAGIVGLYFGIFQALMPAVGYLLGVQFKAAITSVDHWIAFILLGIIGLNMVREAVKPVEECEEADESLDFRTMFGLAVATSIPVNHKIFIINYIIFNQFIKNFFPYSCLCPVTKTTIYTLPWSKSFG